jgi:hypothetical protein
MQPRTWSVFVSRSRSRLPSGCVGGRFISSRSSGQYQPSAPGDAHGSCAAATHERRCVIGVDRTASRGIKQGRLAYREVVDGVYVVSWRPQLEPERLHSLRRLCVAGGAR